MNDLQKLIEQLQGMQGGGKGLFGLGDFATGSLISMGGNVLSGLAGLVSGESWGEKKGKQTYRMAENRLGQDVLHPDQYYADYMRGATEKVQQNKEDVAAKADLTGGQAVGAMWDAQVAPLANFMLQFKARNDELKANRDSKLLSLMGQLGGMYA